MGMFFTVIKILAATATTLRVRVLTAGVVPSRGAVCAVVAIRDRVFRLELTFSQQLISNQRETAKLGLDTVKGPLREYTAT